MSKAYLVETCLFCPMYIFGTGYCKAKHRKVSIEDRKQKRIPKWCDLPDWPPNKPVSDVCAICGASPADYTNGKDSLCSTHKHSSAQR